MFTRSFTVDGTPVAKGRPRFRKLGKFVSTYTPAKTKDFETTFAKEAVTAMRGEGPLETPLALFLGFFMPIPKSLSKKDRNLCISGDLKHIKKPDVDNLAKSVIDAMNGIVYKDDGQVVKLNATKEYSMYPRIEIAIVEQVR